MIKRVRTGAGLAALALAFWADGLAACDLMRDLAPGMSLSTIKRKVGDGPKLLEREDCNGKVATLPAGLVCNTPGVRDARLDLRFRNGQLSGWTLSRQGTAMDLLAYAEKQLGRTAYRPDLAVARPWANLHWQGKGWQASYLGEGDGREVREQLNYWNPSTAGHDASGRPACDRQ